MKICPVCSELLADDAGFCPFDGASLKKSVDPILGRTLAGRFRLVQKLGVGGMSSVYLARHVVIERFCAIKLLRRDLAQSPVQRERFLREARAVNRINHRNIVEITDFGEHEGLAYLVMEYVEGESLLEHIKQGRFPWPRAARIAMQIASALARAHQMGVIHRDLKPENVLIVKTPESDDWVKLTDFGIAKLVDAPALTFSEQMFGTPGYIAPEYVEGLPTDGRADLYALGVVLYEMLTCAMPYDVKGHVDLLLVPLMTAPTPPSKRVEGLPQDLESLVLRLLSRRPDDRPRDGFEVHDALRDILRRFATSKPPPADAIPTGEIVRDAWATVLTETESDGTLVIRHVSEDDPPFREPLQERLTQEVARTPTMDMASRWNTALAEVGLAIARARRRPGRHRGEDRATALADAAKQMLKGVERAQSTVAEHQSAVDRLEARGREFRGNLGRAIDALGVDLSRERLHVEAIRDRRRELSAERETSQGAHTREALLWELAALDAEEERILLSEADLAYQIETLKAEVDRQNDRLDADLGAATGHLEGAIGAMRVLMTELVHTIDEAAAAVSEPDRVTHA